MLRRFSRDGLVNHEPYRGFQLTEAGRQTTWDVIRRERLWERFLVDQLKLDSTQAISWACKLSTATSPEVIDALDAFLIPATCKANRSHGQPTMPCMASAGCSARSRWASVWLTAFDDEDTEVLTYLQRQGLAIGQVVWWMKMGPRRSPLDLRFDHGQAIIGRDLALAAVQTEKVARRAAEARFIS